MPDTLSDPSISSARKSVCDLGVLRTAYLSGKGEVDFRCPAEPETAYLRKGGREVNRTGRVCLCNALLASAGLGQVRPGGVVEPPLVTSGTDLSGVVSLTGAAPGGGYTAADVVNHSTEEDLARIFADFGEEPAASRIARAIVALRSVR